MLLCFPQVCLANSEKENEAISEEFLEFLLEFDAVNDDDFNLVLQHGKEDSKNNTIPDEHSDKPEVEK